MILISVSTTLLVHNWEKSFFFLIALRREGSTCILSHALTYLQMNQSWDVNPRFWPRRAVLTLCCTFIVVFLFIYMFCADHIYLYSQLWSVSLSAILCFIYCVSTLNSATCILGTGFPFWTFGALYIALPYYVSVLIQVSNLLMHHPDLETQEKDMKLSFSSFGKHLMISKVIWLTLECCSEDNLFKSIETVGIYFADNYVLCADFMVLEDTCGHNIWSARATFRYCFPISRLAFVLKFHYQLYFNFLILIMIAQ